MNIMLDIMVHLDGYTIFRFISGFQAEIETK